MELKGDLSTLALEEVFKSITSSGKDGTLIVYDNKSRKEIYFGRDGVRLLSTGERKGLVIGELLLKKRIITPAQLSQALTTQKTTNLKLGEIICHLGFLKQEDLNKIIQNQIEDEICDIFRWSEAKFEFIEGPIPTQTLTSEEKPVSILTLDINLLIAKITQRHSEWERVKNIFNNPKSIFKIADDCEEKFTTVKLTADERRIFSLIGGFKTLEDIVEESPIQASETYKTIYELSQKKVIEEIKPHEVKNYAKQLRNDKRLEGALFFYQQAIKMDPRDLISIENVAEMLEKLDRPTQAGEEYKKLGILLTEKNDVNLAIVAYKKALLLLPHDEKIYASLFNLLVIHKEVPEAVDVAKGLIKLYYRSKNMTNILIWAEKITSIKKPDLELRAYAAASYFNMGEYNKCREEIDKAIKELPSRNIDALIKAYEQILRVESHLSDARYRLSSLRKIKLQQQKKRRKLLIAAASFCFILVIGVLLAWNDYFTYKKFVVLKKETDGFKKKEEYESALIKYQVFKCPFTIYTKSLVHREISDILLILHDKEKKINSNINAELTRLEGLYKNSLEINKKQNDFDGALKILNDVNLQTNQAINNLPQKVYSMGGGDNIIKTQVKNYQEFLGEVQKEIVLIEKYLKSARALYDKAQEMDNADNLEETAKIIRQLVKTYPGSDVAQISKVPVRIESIPSEAEVSINDIKQGKTPLKVYLPVKDAVTIALTCRGFKKHTKEIKSYEQSSLLVLLEKSAKWVFDTTAPLETAPLMVNDIVFITTRDGYLKAIDSQNGLQRWVFRTETPTEIYSSPKINNNIILFGANDNYLYAVRSTAAIKIQQLQLKTANPIRASPFFSSDGQITLISSTDKNLYALSETGAILWKYNANAKISTTGVVDKQTAYITSEDGVLHAIDLKSGDKIWSLSLGGKLNSPIVSENILYVGSTNNAIYVINLITHQIQWAYRLRREVVAPLTVVENILLVPCQDGSLYSIDITTQKLNWQFNTKGSLSGGIAISKKDGVIYFGSEDFCVYAVNLTNGQEIWQYKTHNKIRSTPVIDSKTVYIGSDDGCLYAIDK
jgi:outer membrane protein assembly factor BamB/tetratricopeptide (TPR) repeat protein